MHEGRAQAMSIFATVFEGQRAMPAGDGAGLRFCAIAQVIVGPTLVVSWAFPGRTIVGALAAH
jgi:hypothetical protein